MLEAPANHRASEPWLRGWGESLLVRLRAECGLEGWGVAETQPAVGRAIVEARPHASFADGEMASLGGIAERVIGLSAAAPAPLWRAVYDATLLFGRRGAVLQALSAVDLACADLLGRYLGVGVSTLLGGRYRDTVPAYASMVLPNDVAQAGALGRHVGAAGFGAVKLGWGAFSADDARVLELIEAVLSELPAGCRVAFDPGYERRRSPSETLRLVRALSRYEPLWVEEPCHPDDLEGYARLAARVDVPIAAGEASATAGEFAQLVEAGVEVLQPDLSRCGGFTVARQVAALAELGNRRVVPHAWQNDLLLAATLGFCASLPQPTWAEVCVADTPLREISEPRLALSEGALAVPDLPGLGVTPDPGAVARLRADR